MSRKGKQHSFSARTAGDGLRLLNELRREWNIGWDDLVLYAVCAHYNLDMAAITLSKRETLGND